MADYTTRTAVKLALSIDGTVDDSYIDTLVTSASRWIDSYVNRHFVAESQTRYFDAVENVNGQILFLDDDLLAVTTLTNGDGDTISSGEYVLLPANQSPKYAIKLKSSASVSWSYDDDPEEAISVLGTWGYAAGTPADIEQACKRLVIWMYKMRDVPFLEVGIPEGGFQAVTVTMPNDIRNLLNSYKRYGV